MSAQPIAFRPKAYGAASFKDALQIQKISGSNEIIPEESTPKIKPQLGQNEMHILDERVYSDLQFVLTKKLNDSTKSLGGKRSGRTLNQTYNNS